MAARSAAPPVTILGAGLTGLSAALHLEVPYQLLEKGARVGGHCVTVVDQGYRFDRTGHLLHLRDEAMRELVLSLLRSKPLKVQRRSRIWLQGGYSHYPFQANTRGLPAQVAKDCLLGFIEARDAERNKSEEPKDFEEFILRYMGRGIADHFMVPYNAKLWGVHPREMSPAWTDRFVPKPSMEEVIDGAVGLRRAEIGYNAEFLYPRQGIGELPEALATQVQVRRRTAPKAVDWKRRRVVLAGGAEPYEQLLSTIPLSTLLGLMPGLPKQVARAASQLKCTSLYYLDVALNTKPKKNLHWAYVPEERYPFYRVGSYSNFSSHVAPKGCGSFYVELASRTRPRLDRLLPKVAEGLVEMGLIGSAGDIAFAKVRHLEHAYVIYDHGYRHALDVIHPFLEEHGIRSRGRYGSWEYSAMEDALLTGRDAARAIEESLS